MPRGEKEKYTDKPNHQADRIEEDNKKLGIPNKEAVKSSWATVINEEFQGIRRVLDHKRRFGYKGL
jgi:hypothetical protein